MTKKIIDELIRRRYAEGKTLTLSRINDEGVTKHFVEKYAVDNYGSWTEALKANEANSRKIRVLSKAETVAELLRLQAKGCRMRITDFPPDLSKSIREHYGGYMSAKEEIGIKVQRDKRTGDNRRRDEQEIIKETREAVRKVVNMSEFISQYRYITDYSHRHYGGQDVIFEMAGVVKPPNRVRKGRRPKWSDEQIVGGVAEVVEVLGNTTRNQFTAQGHKSLVNAVIRRYGTWNAGLVALGYEVAHVYRDPKDNMTKDGLRDAVLQELADGASPMHKELTGKIRGFSGTMRRHYEGIKDLLEYCGVCPLTDKPVVKVINDTYRVNLQTPEGIKREVTRMWYVGAPLNYVYIRNHRRHMLDAVNAQIGSWRQAIESIGLDYSTITKQVSSNTLSECGTEFEDLFAEILTELNYEYLREGEGISDIDKTFTLKPDFILPNWRWIDCKLSEWTEVRETLIRYHGEEPNGITIVYLRGRNHRVERGRKWKYEHVSVYQFTKELPEERRKYYDDMLRKIEEKANEGAVAI